MLFLNFHVQGNLTYKSIFAVFLDSCSLDSDNQACHFLLPGFMPCN